MAQPKAMSASPLAGSSPVEQRHDVGVDRLGLERLVVEAGRLAAVALDQEASARRSRPRRRSAWPGAGPRPAPRPTALWPGRGTMSASAREGLEARPASTKRVPTSTSSSGKASTARRNWSAMMALQHACRACDVRFTDASPISTHGVPPMRSSVQNEKPVELARRAGPW